MEEGEAVGDAGLLEEVGEFNDSDVKAVREDGERFKRGGRLVRIDLDGAEKEVNTSVERSLPDGLAGKEVHDGCAEGGGKFFAKGCGHEVSKGGRRLREVVDDGIEEDVVELGDDELLLEDVCRVSQEKDRRKAVLRICEDGRGEAAGAVSLVEKGCMEVEALFLGIDGVLERRLGEDRVGAEGD